ncbi:hypothetical protein K402DRAFT_197332 [Aulographum hederae CBS 113979]|uniref:F-box domain-containing protein n=1 Tax=Aulographum hederae CBS 113979 TaxID=1176131 RepID=A0A6G1GNF9_9PEZI|nr:hypothetical protein K402DRAFT_197332 [Aulographum hederae CBS 113979]
MVSFHSTTDSLLQKITLDISHLSLTPSSRIKGPTVLYYTFSMRALRAASARGESLPVSIHPPTTSPIPHTPTTLTLCRLSHLPSFRPTTGGTPRSPTDFDEHLILHPMNTSQRPNRDASNRCTPLSGPSKDPITSLPRRRAPQLFRLCVLYHDPTTYRQTLLRTWAEQMQRLHTPELWDLMPRQRSVARVIDVEFREEYDLMMDLEADPALMFDPEVVVVDIGREGDGRGGAAGAVEEGARGRKVWEVSHLVYKGDRWDMNRAVVDVVVRKKIEEGTDKWLVEKMKGMKIDLADAAPKSVRKRYVYRTLRFTEGPLSWDTNPWGEDGEHMQDIRSHWSEPSDDPWNRPQLEIEPASPKIPAVGKRFQNLPLDVMLEIRGFLQDSDIYNLRQASKWCWSTFTPGPIATVEVLEALSEVYLRYAHIPW